METEPAGSLAPVNAGKGKWWNGIDSADLSTLTALATDINKAVDQTIKQVARGKIRVGKLLLEARAQFSEDQAFGKWRKAETLVQSKQHAHYLMQVATRFGDAPKLIEGANYSVMQELVLADQSDIEWALAKIEEGDPPTVQEVRSKVKLTQAERLAPKGTSKKGQKPGTGVMLSPHTNINIFIPMGLTRRILGVKENNITGLEAGLIILGMDPDPQTPCHPDTLETISKYWQSMAQTEEEVDAIDHAVEVIVEEFKQWHTR